MKTALEAKPNAAKKLEHFDTPTAKSARPDKSAGPRVTLRGKWGVFGMRERSGSPLIQGVQKGGSFAVAVEEGTIKAFLAFKHHNELFALQNVVLVKGNRHAVHAGFIPRAMAATALRGGVFHEEGVTATGIQQGGAGRV